MNDYEMLKNNIDEFVKLFSELEKTQNFPELIDVCNKDNLAELSEELSRAFCFMELAASHVRRSWYLLRKEKPAFAIGKFSDGPFI